jgi:hypothetical protein
MRIIYLPDSEIKIDEIAIKFSEHRSSVRNKLMVNYRSNDQVIDLGAGMPTLIQRRDIYEPFDDNGPFFFLGYTADDLLKDLEVHYCDQIVVLDVVFDFNNTLEEIALRLNRITPATRVGQGEYFYKELKLVVLDKQEMGGEGNTLGYFYCSTDVSHLV